MEVHLVVYLFLVVTVGRCLCQNNSVFSDENETEFTEPSVDYETKISELFFGRSGVNKSHAFTRQDSMETIKMLIPVMQKFKIDYNQRRYGVFSPFDYYYKSQANEIYKVLMTSDNLSTFYKNAVIIMSLDNVEEEVFIYALYAAVSHSSVTKNVQIPPPYTANSYLFYPAEAIERAASFLKNECDQVFTNEGKIYKKKKYMGPTVLMTDLENSNLNIYNGLNRDGTLNYFREDIDLNSYYYFYAIEDYYLQEQTRDNEKRSSCRSGEQYYYFHRQLLTRYKLEMMANDVPMEFYNFERINEYIQYGFQSGLKYKNGGFLPKRTFQFNVSEEFENGHLRFLLNLAVGIQESLESGYVTMASGELKSLKKAEDLEFLARLVRANVDESPYSSKIRRYLGSSDDEKTRITPSALEQFETTLRDPFFWSLCNQLVEYFTIFKNKLPVYTKEDLDFKGVSITHLLINDPVNIFDARYQTDISSAIYKDDLDQQNYTFVLTQNRTTISYFDIIIKLESDISGAATVRLFITPQVNSNIDETRGLFWEIDAFVHNLDEGTNIIIRKSDKFRHSQPAYDWVSKSSTDEKKVGGFPSGLYLPKSNNGETIPLYLHAIITKYDASDEVRMQNCKRSVNEHIIDSSYYIDGKAFGFPFDRRLSYDALLVTNHKFTEWRYNHTQQ